MDFRDSPEDAAYRATVRAWLEAAVEALCERRLEDGTVIRP